MESTIDRLERWVRHGGTCHLVESGRHRSVVVLCRCDGGEEVERFVTDDPAVLDWARTNGT